MGIPKFHPLAGSSMKHVSLKDCAVVIDATNYFYDLNKKTQINQYFGCEGNVFASFIRKQTYMFKGSNIKCFFVFKGGDTDIDKKLKKFYNNTPKNKEADFVMPVLGKEIVKQVLDELKRDYVTCVAESKEDCVALALHLNCPVISFDSDFCFKQVPYIPSITLKYNKNNNCIDCKEYNFNDFIQKHSLTEEKMAIFAVLSDTKSSNSDTEKSLLAHILRSWGVIDTNPDVQHRKLINWLSIKNVTEILQSISKIQFLDNNAIFLDKYRIKLRSICNIGDGLLTNHLLNGTSIEITRGDASWFEKGVALHYIPAVYINLYKYNVVYGNMDEIHNTYDKLLASRDIIIYAYNLLTNYQVATIKFYINQDNSVDINSNDTGLRKHRYDCKQCVFENGWKNILNHKLFDWFLTENCINTKSLKSENPDAMLLISLVYFGRKKIDIKNITNVVYSVIASHVMLNIVMDNTDYRKKHNKIYNPDCAKAIEATSKYFQSDFQTVSDEKVNLLYEFQYCLLHMNNLNVLCGAEYKYIRYHRSYNATFVYNLFAAMTADSDVFITTLFKRAPSVLSCVKRLVSQYKELL